MKAITNDLTQGKVLPQLVEYAIPMVITSVLQAVYSMTDMIIAGQFIGKTGISAITNASQAIGLITNIAIGLTTGGNILIGQYFGCKDRQGQLAATGTLLSLCVGLGLIALALVMLLATPILTMLGSPALAQAHAYLTACAFGMPFVFLYNAASAVLRGVGNSRKPFQYIAVSVSLNIVLDYIFMGVLHMDTAGAALATVIAQMVSCALALAYIFRQYELVQHTRAFFAIRKSELMRILKLGVPSVLQMTIGSLSWLVVAYLFNGYGVAVSAANGVNIKIKDFCQLFISAMANSAATVIAQNLGAELYDRAKSIMYTAMRITVCMALCMIVIVQLFAPRLVGIFTQEAEVIEVAVLNLRIEIIGQLFYAMFLVYHALAIGAGHSIFAMCSSFVNCILFRVVLATWFNGAFGLVGLYWALTIAPSSSVPICMVYVKSGVWRRSIVSRDKRLREPAR